MCQEGANSGLKTCRLASSRTVAVVIMIASQAAGATIVDGARILPLCISVISRYQALDVRSRVHQDTSPIRRHLISLLPRGWPKVVRGGPAASRRWNSPGTAIHPPFGQKWPYATLELSYYGNGLSDGIVDSCPRNRAM